MVKNKKIIIALVPAIHKGYLDFFKKHKGADFYIVGKDFFKDFPRLERDVRQADTSQMQKIISNLKLFKKVHILDRKNVLNINTAAKIVMPEDEIMREIAEKYLFGKKIKFENIFLRWGWKNATHIKHKISTTGTISRKEFDKKIMKELFQEAKKSSDWWRQIASALIVDGKVLKMTYNHPLPTNHVFDLYGDPRSSFDAGQHSDIYLTIHSEASMIAWAAREGISLKNAELYVTTFPCANCAKSLAISGIKKIYYSEGYSSIDSDEILKKFGIKIIRVEK